MTALASTDEVWILMGRDLTPTEQAQAAMYLDKLSEQFRKEARQQFTPGTSTVRLGVIGGIIYLPERPVVEVASVIDDRGGAVDWTLSGQRLSVDLITGQFATVEYSHGADEVPVLARTTVAEAVKRVLSLDPLASTGLMQASETVGSANQANMVATWAQGGQAMLSPNDLSIARSFRPYRPRIVVQDGPTSVVPR